MDEVARTGFWSSNPRPPRIEALCAGLGVVCLVLTVLFAVAGRHGPLPFEDLVTRIAVLDLDESPVVPPNAVNVHWFYHVSGTIWLATLGVVLVLPALLRRAGARLQSALWRSSALLACTCAVTLFLKETPEKWWNPIAVLMTNPSSQHLLGHRLLFVWVADLVQHLDPSASPLRCYEVSQLVATVLALYAIERWSALLVGESLAWIGQVLATLMMSVCFIYLDFYDIGMVFFFTWGLIALFQRRYAWFPVIVTVGTLNHENILLLIPVAVVLLYDSRPWRRWVPAVAAALVGHVAVRLILQHLMPFEQIVDVRLWTNLVKPVVMWPVMLASLMALVGWYALGLLSLPRLDLRLRRLVILFPMLVAVTLAFGQFHEPRQFDAFIPVLVAYLLVATRSRLLAEPALRDRIPGETLYASSVSPAGVPASTAAVVGAGGGARNTRRV